MFYQACPSLLPNLYEVDKYLGRFETSLILLIGHSSNYIIIEHRRKAQTQSHKN